LRGALECAVEGIGDGEKGGYEKIRRGVWHIHFQRYSLADDTEEIPGANEQVSAIEAGLVSHGVSRTEAKRFTAKYPPEFLEAKIEALEFRLGQGTEISGSGGYLAQSIRDDYDNPKGFKTHVEKEQEAEEAAKKAEERGRKQKAKKAAEERRQALLDEECEKEEVAVAEFLENQSSRDLMEIESEALKPFGTEGKKMSVKVKKAMIRSHVIKLLKASKAL
jgi:hypothetical protein